MSVGILDLNRVVPSQNRPETPRFSEAVVPLQHRSHPNSAIGILRIAARERADSSSPIRWLEVSLHALLYANRLLMKEIFRSLVFGGCVRLSPLIPT